MEESKIAKEKIIYQKSALGCRVLAVASIHYINDKLVDWAAYIDSVPGYDHDVEFMRVAKEGDKLGRRLAAVLFPNLDKDKYRG